MLEFCLGGDDELLLTRLEYVSEETESYDFLMATAFLVPQILATNIAVHDTTTDRLALHLHYGRKDFDVRTLGRVNMLANSSGPGC